MKINTIGSTITGIRMSNYPPSSMSFFYPLPTAGLCALPKFTSIKTRLHGRSVLAAKAASNMSINFTAIVVDSVLTGLDLMTPKKCT